ncbi:hypothetical protein HD806DRAFT_515345 [Xylariaceae sp. AK1471]|nr:hypothetical protein HD806DRAFT_515345 [Xylariaceae sp. AK1471]
MSRWGTFIRSLDLNCEQDPENRTVGNGAVDEPEASPHSARRRGSRIRINEQAAADTQVLPLHSFIPGVERFPFQPDLGLEESVGERATKRASDLVENTNTMNDTSDTTHAPELQESIVASVNEVLTSRLQTERDEIVKRVIDYLLPRIERAAADAAEREVDKFVEEAKGETIREKMQNILIRVHELPDAELETLFLRREVMTYALRRLLRRIELEEADGEWEDVAPGHGARSP